MKLHRIAAAVALLAPAAASADPVTATAYLLTAAGVITVNTAAVLLLGSKIFGGIRARREAKKRAAASRAAYNAGLQDRTIMAPRADAPWQIVYGTAVVSGYPVDIFGTDKTGVLSNTSTYTKADGYKHIVLELAHHPCQAIGEVYIEGVALGTLDGDGYPTGGDYGGSQTTIRQVQFNTTTTLPEAATAILDAWSFDAEFDRSDQTITITGGGLTLNGPAGVDVYVNYSVSAPIRTVRVIKHLGAYDQAVSSYLNTLAPSRYTSNHRLRGITYLVVTLDLEDPRWQGGPPNITAEVTGAKLYDPRKDSTVAGGSGSHRANDPSTWEWSNNPALCIRDFLTQPYGFDTEDGDVDVASVITAANACDALISLTVGGTTETNQKTYTCDGSFTTEQAKEAVLQDLAECMAGTVTDGAGWSVQAGVWTAPVLTLTDDDLAGPVEVLQSDTPIDELFNGVKGKLMLAGAQSPSDINPYKNATFVTADGVELWTDVELPFTNHLARARNLSRIAVERVRAGQVLRYPAKFRAWVLRIGDRVTLTHAPYGITALTYRVTDWQWSPGAPVLLTLQRDAASIWDLADAATANPTPSTDLPNPWQAPAMSSVTASSGGTTLVRTLDGSVVPRVLVEWGAVTDPFVLDNGRVEVLWRRNEDTTPTLLEFPAEDRAAYILGVAEFDRLLIEVRTRNNRQVRGPSTFIAHEVVGKSAAPSNVASFGGSISKGRITWTWNPCPDVDYSVTEVRSADSNWGSDSVLPLFRGRSNTWAEIVSTTGARTRYARHFDESGNPSASSVTATVTVAAGDLIVDGTGGVDATAYWLASGAGSINRAAGGTYTPASVTFSAYSATGSAAPAAYSGRFIVATSNDGSTYTTRYTSASDESSTTYTPPAGIKTVRVRLYLAGGTSTLIDEEVIPVTEDGANGSGLSEVVSNRAHALPSDNDGTVTSYTGSGTTIQVFEGATALQFNTTLAAGRFSIGTPTVSPSGALTVGARSGSGTTTATVAVHSGASVSADVITVTYPITARLASGTDVSFNVTQTLTKAKTGAAGDLVLNGGFELGAYSWGSQPANHAIVNDAGNAFAGSWVARCQNTDGVGKELGVNRRFGVIEGQRLQLVGRARASGGANGQAFVRLNFYDAAGSILSYETTAWSVGESGSWLSKVQTFSVPAGAITAAVAVGQFSQSAGTWWIDAVDCRQAGADAKTVRLTSSSDAFLVRADGTNAPSSITFTAAGQNLTGNPSWSTTPAVTLGGSSTSATRTLSFADFGANTSVAVTVTWDGQSDTVTILRLADGSDAVVAAVPNQAHTVPAANDGTVTSYAGSGTTIRVFEGDDLLTFHTTLAAGRFTVGTPTVSPVGAITVGARSGSGTTLCTVADHSAMTADAVVITYPITARRANGTDFAFEVQQTVTKSRAGAAGAAGADGATGQSVFVATVYIQATSAPSTPTGGSFAFATGTLTPPSSWSAARPAFNPAAATYATTFTFVGATPTSTVTGGTWSTPVKLDTGAAASAVASWVADVSQLVIGAGTASATLQLNTNGTTTLIREGEAGTAGPNWYVPTTTGIGSSFEVVGTYSGAALSAGTLNSPLALSSARSFTLSRTINGESEGYLLLDFIRSGAVEGRGACTLFAGKEP